jgi:uncharacterized protein YgiM (DUF1202 family)
MKKLIFICFLAISSLIFSGCNPLEFKQQAGLQVVTGEIDASLFLDDQYLDKTPYINEKIKPGNYNLRIQPDDSSLIPYDIPITLNKGTITIVEWQPNISLETSGGTIYEMEKSSDTILEFQTIPNNAILTLDDGVKQFSPLVLQDAAEGNHSFEVSLPSYITQQKAVNVFKDHHITLTIILAKELNAPAIELEEEIPEATKEAEPTSLLDEENQEKVQILSTGFFVDEKEVLRIRKEPSSSGAELGFAEVGKTYPFKEEVTGWISIEFNGQVGWISDQYSQKISSSNTDINYANGNL